MMRTELKLIALGLSLFTVQAHAQATTENAGLDGQHREWRARWVTHPTDGKAEALRQAQMALLRGPAEAPNANGERGFQTRQGTEPGTHETGYSHPFYWAPFVLIGNYQ